MECKFCGAQLDEDVTLCPVCQKDNAEEAIAEAFAAGENTEETTEDAALDAMQPLLAEDEPVTEEASVEQEEPIQAPGNKLWVAILAGVGILALLAVLVAAVWYGVSKMSKPNDVYFKDNYSVELRNPEKAEKTADEKVAVVEDKVLDNAQFQIYYNMTINEFANYYGYYLTTLGLDINQPLDAQPCSIAEKDMSWQQYFIENSLGVWHRYTVLSMMAQEEGFTLSSELEQQLDELAAQIETWAQQYGFADAQAMLEADFGPLCNMDAYLDYMKTYYLAMEYQQAKQVSMDPTDEEVALYFAENEQTFADNNITKDSGKYYDVRHILIAPQGGVAGDDGTITYTDEQWEAALAEAEALLSQWQTEGGTEETFAALAAMHSADSGSSSNGGLYSQLTSQTNFVEEFKAWYMDENRQIGDTGIVQSVHGYHIMYFCGSQDIWFYNAKTSLLSDLWNTQLEEGIAKWPMEVSYKKIALADQVEEETAEPTVTEGTAAATE